MAKKRERRILKRVEFEKIIGKKVYVFLPADDKVLLMNYMLEQTKDKLEVWANNERMPVFIRTCAQQLIDRRINDYMEVYAQFKAESDAIKGKVGKSE